MERNGLLDIDELIEGCKKGDLLSFKLLYDKYAKAMYNTAFRILANEMETEDVLQDAFSDAFQKIDSFRNKSTFGYWLKRIVINKSVDNIKKRKLKFQELKLNTEDLSLNKEIDERQYEFKIDEVLLAIEKLPDGYRTILSLYLFENHSHQEIADLLGIAASTVRSQYRKAKQKVKETCNKEQL
jgi:RNA polymerase sigma factor (sigma-70 family)